MHWVNDPGHGWLVVPLKDVVAAGVAERITAYSYMTMTHAYLEEDVDAGVFLAAKWLDGQAIPDRYVDRTPIRSYRPFDAALAVAVVREPLRLGDSVVIRGTGQHAEIIARQPKHLVIRTTEGQRYRVTANRALYYLDPASYRPVAATARA